MTDDNPLTPDPVDAVLLGNGQPLDADALHKAVLARTVGVIRRRRRIKRGLLVVSLAACYLAGAATVGLWRADARQLAPTPTSNSIAKDAPSQATPPDADRPTTPVAAPMTAQTPAPAKEPTAFESWRNVGDYYLREYGDISLAAASYAQAIDLATVEERAIAPDHDNWLLMALKDARTKEHGHAEYQQN